MLADVPELPTGVSANVTVPNDRTRSAGAPPTSAARQTNDGKRVFQMTAPTVIWWSWVGILVLALADLLIQGHSFVSVKIVFGALAVTGLIYACTIWSKVIADDQGIEVRNPVRRFLIPWPAVRGIFLADSVEVECARRSPKKNKTVYTWALSSPRRTRARAQLRAWQWDQGKRNRPAGYERLPDPARSLVKMTTAEIMARELAAMADDARFRSVVRDVEVPVIETGAVIETDARVETDARAETDAVVEADAVVETEAVADAVVEADAVAEARRAVQPGSEVMSARWSWPALLGVLLPVIGLVICFVVK
jgi:hypothetical protein